MEIILSQRGYKVLLASNGAEALDLHERNFSRVEQRSGDCGRASLFSAGADATNGGDHGSIGDVAGHVRLGIESPWCARDLLPTAARVPFARTVAADRNRHFHP